MQITDRQQELIENLIEKFNFQKVLIAMTALDWKWVNPPGECGHSVPTINRMKHQCRNLLYRSIVNETVSTGGFEAKYYSSDDNENEEESFELSFILAQSCTSFNW
jgi:hypothetical protein